MRRLNPARVVGDRGQVVTLGELTKDPDLAKLRSRMFKGLLVRALPLFFLVYLSLATEASSLQTPENIPLSVPAASVAASGIPGSTKLSGTNFIMSAVVPATSRGGSASLVNTQQVTQFATNIPYFASTTSATALRPDGGFVSTAFSYSYAYDTNGYNFITLCYAADGTLLWTNFYDGPGHGDDLPHYIAAGANGNVWVAGQSMRYATNDNLTDAVLLCYASNGIPLWTNRYTSSITNGDESQDLAVDKSGNAFLTVISFYWNTNGSGTYIGNAIIKFDPLGNPLWTNAPAGAIALDPAGNLFVSREIYSGTELLKLAGDGTPLWTNDFLFDFHSQVDMMRCNSQGDVIVASDYITNYPLQYVVTKYSGATGTPVWTNTMPGPNYGGGSVPQTFVTRAGDVIMIGGAAGATVTGLYQVMKFNSNGVPVWTNLNANIGTTNSELAGATVDNAGNFYLTGYAPDPVNSSADFVTMKYSSSGQALWTNFYDGAAGLQDYPNAVVVNGNGDVFVTGSSENSNYVYDFTVIAYRDVLTYAPPTNFVGLDAISYTLADAFGDSAAGSAQVWVTSTNNFGLMLLGNGSIPAGVQLGVEGAPGTNMVIVEASTDLVHWQPLFTNAPVGGTVQYTDTSATGFARRFYRAEQLP